MEEDEYSVTDDEAHDRERTHRRRGREGRGTDDEELARLVDQRVDEARQTEGAHDAQQRHGEDTAQGEGKKQDHKGKQHTGKGKKKGKGEGKEQQGDDEGKYGRLHREMSRWIRVSAAAPKWQGRQDTAGWKVFGADGAWIAAQGWARTAVERGTRTHRKEALEAAIAMHTEDATQAWAAYTRTLEGDTLIKAMTAAVNEKGKGPASKGGVYAELYKILRAGISGRSELAGDQRVKAVYKGGDKEKGLEVHGAQGSEGRM